MHSKHLKPEGAVDKKQLSIFLKKKVTGLPVYRVGASVQGGLKAGAYDISASLAGS